MRISLAVALIGLGAASPAAAADYLFSFSTGGSNIKGELFNVGDDGDASRSQAIITSGWPSPTVVGPHLGYDSGTFVVNNGQIVGGYANYSYRFAYQGYTSLTLDPHDTYSNIATFDSFSRATGPTTFTLVPPGSGPEPATWAMLILGFGVTGATLRRRRRTGAAQPA